MLMHLRRRILAINPHASKVKDLVSICVWRIVKLHLYCPVMRCETGFRTKITGGFVLNEITTCQTTPQDSQESW